MTDVPTVGATSSNYATLNPLAVGPYATLANANTRIIASSSSNSSASYSTIGMTTGKWYFEITNSGSGYDASHFGYALVADQLDAAALLQTGFAGYRTSGSTYGTVSSTFASWAAGGEVIGVAVDCDNGAVYFARNNTWINSGDPTSGASKTGAITTYTGGSKTLYGGAGAYQNSSQFVDINFGQRPFSYTPPTGFVALNTYNLPASTITNGAAYMAATTYTGTGASLTVANTVGSTSFQPDWVWVKSRSAATDHALYDSVRGVQKQIESNSTGAETTETTGLTAFGSTGFTVGALAQMNTSAATYVAWQWKAGTTSASNTNGSITSTVSAGATQGFSVVTYTGTGANATVGHGLGVAPSMVIVKKRAGATTGDWAVWHTSLGTNVIYLNSTGAAGADSTWFQSTIPTSSVFSIGTAAITNQSTSTYVAYCFSAVAGYSAFGSFTGNGSADGPFVYTGFRPAFVMAKLSSATGDWNIVDDMRQTYNDASGNPVLRANLSSAEEDVDTMQGQMDILSNGFKLRSNNSSLNASGGTIIYAAFAENPFKNALAR
jgi:hypothetical protein